MGKLLWRGGFRVLGTRLETYLSKRNVTYLVVTSYLVPMVLVKKTYIFTAPRKLQTRLDLTPNHEVCWNRWRRYNRAFDSSCNIAEMPGIEGTAKI